jgi:hypothetical protein
VPITTVSRHDGKPLGRAAISPLRFKEAFAVPRANHRSSGCIGFYAGFTLMGLSIDSGAQCATWWAEIEETTIQLKSGGRHGIPAICL